MTVTATWLPLPAEAHTAVWQEYAAEAAARGAFAVLNQRLPQLRFPIQAGISATDAYRAATLRGIAPRDVATVTSLSQPDNLRLVIEETPAGPLPVLIPAGRRDFVALVQALAHRNEPWPVPDSMGACMVTGYNNWDRIRRYQAAWAVANPDAASQGGWTEEFRRLRATPEQYQDRFLIISDGPYSGVLADDLGLDAATWADRSLTIRRAHECVHYLTHRVLGVARNDLLDETVADYAGIVAATGRFRKDWFLRFMGLERHPAYRGGGRFENYLGSEPRSPEELHALRATVAAAADNLERFDQTHGAAMRGPSEHARLLIAMMTLGLDALAHEQMEQRLLAAWEAR